MRCGHRVVSSGLPDLCNLRMEFDIGSFGTVFECSKAHFRTDYCPHFLGYLGF